jgi:hypothetical protein
MSEPVLAATTKVLADPSGPIHILLGLVRRRMAAPQQRPRDLIAELNVLTGQKVGATGIVREAGWVLAVA